MHVIRILRECLGTAFPIIGVGGISSPEHAAATRAAGANLIQLYTGLIYEGPSLISKLVRDDSDRPTPGTRAPGGP
jgi:dihydroorotate dehydrogenase